MLRRDAKLVGLCRMKLRPSGARVTDLLRRARHASSASANSSRERVMRRETASPTPVCPALAVGARLGAARAPVGRDDGCVSLSSRYASGAGPGPITPDGCAVELYAQLPPGHREADVVSAVAKAGATVLELGAGAGRVTQCLTQRGFQVVAVDESAEMLAHVAGAETVVAKIEQLDLGRRFDVVMLASHLVNVPDDGAALQMLSTCGRHASRQGQVLIERRRPGWFETAHEVEVEQDGILYRLTDITRISADTVRASMSYTAGQRTWTHTFVTRRVSDDDLVRMLQSVGLRLSDYVDNDRTWAQATVMDK